MKLTLTASSLLLVGTLKFLYQYFQNSAFVKVLNWGLGSHEDQTAEMVLIWSSYYTKVLILKPNDWWSPGGGPIDSSFLKRFLLFSERGVLSQSKKSLSEKNEIFWHILPKRGGGLTQSAGMWSETLFIILHLCLQNWHYLHYFQFSDIIHYFFKSTKIMSLLFILFKTLDYFQQFLQERLAHKALGLLQVAHSSERVRERDEQWAQGASIYTGAPVYA